ncbi:hypothetical protein OROMI_023080 [Orobanche minor]
MHSPKMQSGLMERGPNSTLYGCHSQSEMETMYDEVDFQLEENSSFTSLLQQSALVPMETCSAIETPPNLVESSSTEKRGKNFNMDEDKLLVSAWLNTSLDAVIGTNMKGGTFWKRVETYYMQEKKNEWQPRTLSSLNHRWSAIQHAVNKFCGFLTQIEGRNQSGVTHEDNIQAARKMYSSIMKGPFKFDHCWDLLKNEPKWKHSDQSTAVKRKLPGSSRRVTAEAVNVVETDEPSKVDNNERPIGRKLAKERKRASKNPNLDVPGLTNVLSSLKEEKQKKTNLSNEQRSEFLQIQKAQLLEAQVANRIQNEKLRLEQDKEDDSIMMKDLSGLDLNRESTLKSAEWRFYKENMVVFSECGVLIHHSYLVHCSSLW